MNYKKTHLDNIGLLIGETGSLKTSFLFHYAYLTIEKLKEIYKNDNKEDGSIYGIIICNQNKLEENNFYYGKYSEVYIGHLKQIRLKYAKSYEDIINFLTFFRKIPVMPAFVFIDEPASFLKHEPMEARLSKMAFLYHKLESVAKLIPEPQSWNFKVIVSEQIKFKEIENNHKDKENMSVFMSFFKYMIVGKIMYIDDPDNPKKGDHDNKDKRDDQLKKFVLKRVFYRKEAEQNQKKIEFLDYGDNFIQTIISNLNDSFIEMYHQQKQIQ